MTKPHNPYEVSVERLVAGVERQVRMSAAQATEEAFFGAVRDALYEVFENAKAQARRFASRRDEAVLEAATPLILRGVLRQGADRGYAIASPATNPERTIRFPFRVRRGKHTDSVEFDVEAAGEVEVVITEKPAPAKALASKKALDENPYRVTVKSD